MSLRNAATWVGLFCAALLAYWPALQGTLVWDDGSHVTKLGLQSFRGLWRIWFDLGATQQYYPLLHSAFWLEHRMWGDSVMGYHLTSVALHAVSACLVVMIARRLSLPGAWFAGFIFAVHPVCVESVAWISEQKSTLSAVFYLAAALTYLHFDRTRRRSQYFLALGLFALAILSKTVTATLPAVLLVVFWWQRGRLDWRRDVLPLLPWFGLAVPAGLFTAWVERAYVGAQGADFALTVAQRCLLAGRAIWFYATKVLWPADLMFSYPRWEIDSGVWWQYLFPAGVVVAAVALWRLSRRHRGPLAAFLIFGGTLFPVLGFLNVLPFRYSFVADHFQYLASLGIIVPVTSVLMAAAGRISPHKLRNVAVPTILVAVLAVLTWGQSGTYRDSETLYRETLARNPASWLAHNNLGSILFLTPGRLPEAVQEFEAAVRAKPDLAEGHDNLGNALAQTPGRLPEAITEYREALRINPSFPEAHNNLGNALSQIPGRLPEAVAEYQEALRINPNFANAHFNLGNVLAHIPGGLPEAIREYQAALRIEPGSAKAHDNLGNTLAQVPGRLAEAIAEYEAALRIEPDSAEVHGNLGNALAQIRGRLPEAVAQYKEALQINPNYAEAHSNLAMVLSAMPGRRREAIAECEEALRLRPDLEAARELLGELH